MPAVFDILPTFSESPYSYIIVPIILVISIVGFYYKPVFHALLLHPYEICRGKRLHTLLTSALIHRNWVHLLINALLIFGLLFDLFGVLKVEKGPILAYGLSLSLLLSFIIIPNLFLTYSYKDDFSYTAVGASGLTFALYGFSAMFFPLEHMSSLLIKAIKNSGHYWLYFFVIIFVLSFIKSLSINRKLHLVAFLFGSICVFLVRPSAFAEFLKCFIY